MGVQRGGGVGPQLVASGQRWIGKVAAAQRCTRVASFQRVLFARPPLEETPPVGKQQELLKLLGKPHSKSQTAVLGITQIAGAPPCIFGPI